MVEKGIQNRLNSLTKEILLTLGMVGFAAVAAFSGNAIQLLKYTPLGDRKRSIKAYEINKYLKRLVERGLIEKYRKNNVEFIQITDEGKRLLLRYELEGLHAKKRQKWDGLYRVVIFDITEDRRQLRDKLRSSLRSFGFLQMQQSVWIYPYACRDIIELLKKYLNFKGEVIYMTVNDIDIGESLKKDFNLK